MNIIRHYGLRSFSTCLMMMAAGGRGVGGRSSHRSASSLEKGPATCGVSHFSRLHPLLLPPPPAALNLSRTSENSRGSCDDRRYPEVAGLIDRAAIGRAISRDLGTTAGLTADPERTAICPPMTSIIMPRSLANHHRRSRSGIARRRKLGPLLPPFP